MWCRVWQLQTAKESQIGEEIGFHSRILVFFKLGKKRFRVCFAPQRLPENHMLLNNNHMLLQDCDSTLIDPIFKSATEPLSNCRIVQLMS